MPRGVCKNTFCRPLLFSVWGIVVVVSISGGSSQKQEIYFGPQSFERTTIRKSKEKTEHLHIS